MRLVNKSKMEAAVRLSIDGLNVFTFCDEKHPDKLSDGKLNPLRGQSVFDLLLVPAGGSVEVPGWIISRSKVLGFKVTSYPNTAVAQTGRDQLPTGTITATFSYAWEKGQGRQRANHQRPAAPATMALASANRRRSRRSRSSGRSARCEGA